MIGFRPLARKALNLSLALSLAAAQLFAPISAFIPKAYASAISTFNQFDNVGGDWQNGNLDADLFEGDSVPFRAALTGLTSGSHVLQISYDNVDSNKHAYDYLTSYNRTVSPNPCVDEIVGCISGTAGAIPTDPTLSSPPGPVSQVPGVVNIFGAAGSSISVNSVTYSSTPGHVLAGANKQTVVNISFTTDTNKVILAWGGHIAKEGDWGADTGASAINGSPYHMRIGDDGLDGQGGSQDRSMKASSVTLFPRITITKVVQNGSAQPDDFTFNVSPSINGQSLYSIPDGQNSVTIFDVSPDGDYTITENSAPGYGFVGGSGTNCTFSDSTATASVAAGTAGEVQHASCTFTNGQLPGKIIIQKQTLPDGNQQSFAFTTNYGGGSFNLSDGQSNDSGNLSPGTYSVSETVPTGWDLTSAVCDDGSPANAIVLGAGETVTCVFTNTKRGHLIVQKTTNPASDPTVFTINATSSTGGTITGGGAGTITDALDKDYEVTPGTYSVTETLPGGWSKDESDCQNVVVAPGATEYCTITNTKLSTIVIIKDALPNDSFDFSFLTATLPGGNFSLDDDSGAVGEDATLSNQATFANLTPNTAYTVSESSAAGWQLTGLTCDKGNYNIVGSQVTATPAPGETITCTFTNTKLRSISGTKYTANISGLGPVLSGWTIFIDTNDNDVLDSGELFDVTDTNGNYSFDNLLPGTYILKEVLQAGWTQIFSPSAVNLTYNADSTGNDFGNFENGSVSGYKWNDINGDGAKTDDEPKLSGWTIRLLRSSDNTEGNYVEVATTVTDGNGNYSFTNLSPLPSRFYAVCEVQQDGWVQTSPLSNACRYFEINRSGDTNTGRNFGNQGRGNIHVVKNVDNNGDGDTTDPGDVNGATDWTWDLGSTNFATGSTQNVAAGTYTVHEDQKTDFHVVGVVCDTQVNAVSESAQVVVTPGATVTCTFTNARDTGTITVNKVVNPNPGDNGLFNLQIDGGTAGTGANVGHGGTTGPVQVVTGTHNAGETAGTSTSLADYSTSYVCVNGQQVVKAQGSGTLTTDFNVASNESVTCTITNVRYGHIIVEKQTDPDGSAETFEFDTSYDFANFNLTDGQQNNSGNLLPGTYSVTELAETGWDLTSVVCTDRSDPANIDLAAGETVTCVFTNTQDANIVVVKQTDPNGDPQTFSFNASYDQDGFSLSDGQQNDSGDLDPGTYSVSENVPAGWDLETATCSDGSLPSSISLQAGETVTCTFTNEKDAKIIVVKQTDPDGSAEVFDFTASYDGNGFSLSDGQQNDSGDLDPGTYSVSEIVPNGWQLKNTQCSDGSDSSAIGLSAGEVVTCTFTNEQDAHIVVVKQTNPDGSPQVFNFTASYDGDGFSLSDGQSNNSGDLDPGIYSVSETVPSGWDLDSVICSDGSDPSAINLSAGETVTCTFTNEQDANIVVVKQTDPDGSNQSFSFNASYDGDGFSLSDGQQNDSGDLDPGTYSVSENTPAGWDLDSVVCSDQSDPSAISLQAGETVTCTFTNEQDANILVVKQTNPDGSPQVFNFTASYDGDGFALSDGQTNDSGDLDPGTYAVSENVPTGWDLETATCDDGSPINGISLQAGETVTCTFTNEQDARIIVVKQTNPAGSQQQFNFTPSYGDSFLLSDNQSNDSGDLDPGLYSVSETVPEGWDQIGATCDDGSVPSGISLSAGEVVTCTFTNEQDSNIVVVKQTDPTGDPQIFTFNASYSEGSFGLSDGQQNDSGDLDPGTYDVSEDTLEGWDLTSATCDNEDDPSEITISAGETVTCTFINQKRGQVIVTKYKDLDRDGEYDADDSNTPAGVADPTLSGWTFNLSKETPQTTGDDGTATFANLFANQFYDLSEEEQTGWTLSDIDCDSQFPELALDIAQIEQVTSLVFVAPGQTVNCFVGNYQAPALLIAKENNRPDPTVVGDTVTYTLTVTVPLTSGAVFDVITQDLPPEGFSYVPGSWTASSSVRGDIKNSPTTEPTYGSPGEWILGTMIPGEVVTLTYQALIASTASAGTYPDVAFANGCELPFTEGDCEVLSNVSAGADSPFVATRVTIKAPQVLGASTTVLVNTGTADIWRNLMVGTMLIGVGLATLVRRQKKGAQL